MILRVLRVQLRYFANAGSAIWRLLCTPYVDVQVQHHRLSCITHKQILAASFTLTFASPSDEVASDATAAAEFVLAPWWALPVTPAPKLACELLADSVLLEG